MNYHISKTLLMFCTSLFLSINASDCINNWQLPEEQQQYNTNNDYREFSRQLKKNDRANTKNQNTQSLYVTKIIQKKTHRY
jgi:hypothetical protein